MKRRILTVAEAAVRLGVTRQRVLQMIHDGLIPAERFGPAWMLRPADVRAFKPRPAGNPDWIKKGEAAGVPA